jgi:hypothetical protein
MIGIRVYWRCVVKVEAYPAVGFEVRACHAAAVAIFPQE